MVTFLLWSIGYVVIGYGTFRVWTWRCRPQEDLFGNNWFVDDHQPNEYKGWYIPAWVDPSPTGTSGDLRRRPRGQAVEVVFWQSVSGWPIVWSIVFFVKTYRGLNRAGEAISNSVVKSAVKRVIPAPLPVVEESEELQEARREVERLLAQEN